MFSLFPRTKFNLVPNSGVEILRFGDPAEKVKSVLGKGNGIIRRGSDLDGEKSLEYSFRKNGLFVEVSPAEEVIAFQFHSQAKPMLFGKNLLGLNYAEASEFIMMFDEDAVEEELGAMFSYRMGIGTYAPHADDDPERPLEAIILFVRGYYEENYRFQRSL